MEMKRVVVFLPPQTVKASEALAARYGSNRSEVLRLAVAEGLQPVRPVLARLQRVRLAELGGGVPVSCWVVANGVTGRLRLVPLGSFRSMRRRPFLNWCSTARRLDGSVQVSRRGICG